MEALIVLTALLAAVPTLADGTRMPPERHFEGLRALMVAPGRIWEEWDSALFGALEERGFEVTRRKELGEPGSLAAFDLIALNAERRLTEAEQAALTRYVAAGGAAYVSFDQPYAWGRGAQLGAPGFVREAGKVAGARPVTIREVAFLESPLTAGLGPKQVALRDHVGCFQGTSEGWTTVALYPLPEGTPTAQDPQGNVLGVLGRHGKGRTAVLGLPLEQEKYLAQPELGPLMLDNLLGWLLEARLTAGPAAWSNVVTVAVPARAQVQAVYVDGRAVSDPEVRTVGSLEQVRVDVSRVGVGGATEVRVQYMLRPGRNVDTVIHLPWGALRAAANSPAALAEYLASLHATVCQPLLRSSSGNAWYRGLPDDVADDALVTNYKGDFLAELIEECHKRGIRLIAGVYLDNRTPTRKYPEATRVDRQGREVRDRYGNGQACFNNPKGQEHNLATVEQLLATYRVDGLILDDNYWLDYSDMYACWCAYCREEYSKYCAREGIPYRDPSEASDQADDPWWRHKREATHALLAKVRAIAEAHRVPFGGWVSNGMGMLHLAGSFDFLGEMTYQAPPRAMRGPLSALGEKGLICLLWTQHVEPAAMEQEAREAVHAGCAAVGFWTMGRDGGYRLDEAREAAMRRAFASVEDEWLRFYADNVLRGDPRFVVQDGKADAGQLSLRIRNTGAKAARRTAGELDLSAFTGRASPSETRRP